MRLVLIFLAFATTAAAQPLPPSGPSRIDSGPLMPSIVGGALGYLGGGSLGYVSIGTRPDGTLEFDRASVYGFAGGAALGAGLGVPLSRLVFDEPTGSVWKSLGGALLGQAAAVGLGLAVERLDDTAAGFTVFVVASPILSVGGATIGADG